MTRARCLTARAAVAAIIPLITVAATSPAEAQHGTATASFVVRARVTQQCLVSSTPIDFRRLDRLAAGQSMPLQAGGSIGMACSGDTRAIVELEPAPTRSVRPHPRRISAGPGSAVHLLLQDPAARGRDDRLGRIGRIRTGSPLQTATLRVIARVAPGPEVRPDQYTGTATATIHY